MRTLIIAVLVLCAAGTAQAGFMDAVDKLVTGSEQIREQLPPSQEQPPAQPRHETPTPGEDRHYIQADDYFISDKPLQGHEWIYVQLSKLTAAPSAATKDEAEFFKVTDGNKLWTRYFWHSRLATSADIKLGAQVIMFEGNNRGDVYDAPAEKAAARRDAWFMARVTDVSDTYKGFITVSGGYKASLENLRVPVVRK